MTYITDEQLEQFADWFGNPALLEERPLTDEECFLVERLLRELLKRRASEYYVGLAGQAQE